jgi:monoamine oxidase
MDRRDFLRAIGAVSAFPLLAACVGDDGVVLPTTGTGITTTSGPIPDPGNLPPLKASAVTNWSADPFALGSYSHLRPGGRSRHREALAAPEGGRLFFAGEATNSDFPSTVHGALDSGQRAADEVDDALGGEGSVVVVGAGAAGIAAASQLHEQGYRVVVVEARDRVGGRVWTTSLEGVPFDLGASWIHGTDGNPLTDLAVVAGVDLAATDYDSATIFDTAGDEVSPQVYQQLDELVAELDQLDGDMDESVGDLLFEAGYDPDDPLHRFVVTSVIEHEFAEDVAGLGVAAAVEGEEFSGGDAIVPAGYWRLFDGLVSALDVRTGVVVESIEHDDETVTISGGTEVFEADAAVITLPVGVLAAGSVEFSPRLGEDKRQALEFVGMGVLDKAVLLFDNAFWTVDTHILGRVSSSAEWAEWVNLAAVAGVPAVMGFNAGSVARRLARGGPEAVLDSALAVAGRMLG